MLLESHQWSAATYKVQILEKGKFPFQPHPSFSSPTHPTTHQLLWTTCPEYSEALLQLCAFSHVPFAWYFIPIYINPNQVHMFSICPSRSALYSSPAQYAGRLTFMDYINGLSCFLASHQYWLTAGQKSQGILFTLLFPCYG